MLLWRERERENDREGEESVVDVQEPPRTNYIC